MKGTIDCANQRPNRAEIFLRLTSERLKQGLILAIFGNLHLNMGPHGCLQLGQICLSGTLVFKFLNCSSFLL